MDIGVVGEPVDVRRRQARVFQKEALVAGVDQKAEGRFRNRPRAD